MDNNYKGIYISYIESDSDFDIHKRVQNIKTLILYLEKYSISTEEVDKYLKFIETIHDEKVIQFLCEDKGLIYNWDKIEEDLTKVSYMDFCDKIMIDFETIKEIYNAKKLNKFVQ